MVEEARLARGGTPERVSPIARSSKHMGCEKWTDGVPPPARCGLCNSALNAVDVVRGWRLEADPSGSLLHGLLTLFVGPMFPELAEATAEAFSMLFAEPLEEPFHGTRGFADDALDARVTRVPPIIGVKVDLGNVELHPQKVRIDRRFTYFGLEAGSNAFISPRIYGANVLGEGTTVVIESIADELTNKSSEAGVFRDAA